MVKVAGKNLYRTSAGKLIELPPDITAEEAAKLEADANAALTRIGKGPPPKPVPEVTKEAKPAQKPKAAPKGKKGSKAKGGAGRKPGSPGTAALKAAANSKVAQYLVAKATPVLAKGFNKLQKLRQNEQTHDDAAEKRAQADAAVVIPPSDSQSKSNAGQVSSVSVRPAPVVDPNKGKQVFQAKLQENVPKSIEDVDNFKRDKKAQHVGTDVMEVVQGDKNAVVSTFQDMGQTPPPAPREHEPENLPPPEIAPPTATMNLGKDAIAPLQKEHTDVSKFTNEADSKLKEEGVSQEQLDMVDSGDLASANKEKKGMEKAAKEEPLAVQKFAQQENAKVDKDLKQQENKQRQVVNAKRKAGLGATGQKQKGAKSALEKKREEVAAKINGIYTAAQDKVKKRLADLETQSMKRFDDGNAKATKQFEEDVNNDLKAFKADRYSGWFGWARKAKDWLLGMDDLPEVKAIFDRNRAKFVTAIEGLVTNISNDNKQVVQECKDELQNARKKIQEYVDGLGPSMRDIGKKTAEEMNSKLDEMDKFVAKKEEDLQNQLKDKQTAAIKAIDEKIEKMKEAMAGALSKLGKLLLLAAKKFFTWALGKFGFSLAEIEGIISKGAAVLKAIFTQPIKFVKNLISAASLGFKNFGKNFLKHLQDAVFEWLTGALEGVTLPSTWDLKGIAGLIFQLVGISYANLKKFLVKYIPAPVVEGLEKTFTLLQTLYRDGPMAAWEQLKDMANEMKDSFVDAIKDWIKWKVIEKAIETVLSLFIPGAGIIRAIIGIYDTVVFFIQKAKDIMKMIGSFLGSIAEIAAGNIGAAATALENGLARGLVLVIDFLARFLRLKGITNAIKKVLDKIRGKVDGVLDKLAKWVATKAKGLWSSAKATAAKILSWWKVKKPFTGADGKAHTITVDRKGKQPVITVRSTEKSLEELINLQTQPLQDQLKLKLAKIKDVFSKEDPDPKDAKAQEARHSQVQKIVDEIALALGPMAIRPTVVTSALAGGGRALRVIAEPLTKQPGNTKGSPSKGVQHKDLISAIVQPKPQTITPKDGKKTERQAFSMFSSAHLLADRLNGPGIAWNLANTGKGLNSGMKKPEGIAEGLKDRGGEVKYVTVLRYREDFPPSDRNKLAAGTREQKIKWLGGLVAQSYTVNIVTLKPPPGEAIKSYPTFECKDPDDFLQRLDFVGEGQDPTKTNAQIVLKFASETAEDTPAGKLVRGINFLQKKANIGNDEVTAALKQLVKEGSLELRGGRYYLPA